MSNLQIIESLCSLAEELSAIIRTMDLSRGGRGAAFGEDELAAADEQFRRLIGRENQSERG